MERIIGRAFAFLVGASCASVALAVACGGIVDDEQTPAAFADATPVMDARADLDGGATRDADASTPKDPCVGPPGTLDMTFGNGGVVVVPGLARATSVVVLSDDSVVLGSVTPNGPPTHGGAVLVRLRPEGTLDPAFGKGGMAALPLTAPLLAAQADGKLLIATTTFIAESGTHWAVMRRLGDGGPDPSFNGGAEVVIGFAPSWSGEMPASITVQPDGRILVSGEAPGIVIPPKTFYAVARLQTDGAFDRTFAQRGARLISVGPTSSQPGVLALAPDGSMIVAGGSVTPDAGTPSKPRYDLSAARVTSDGGLEPSFGDAGGIVVEREQASQALAATFDSDGRLVLAGYLGNELAVFRMTPSGATDPTFGDAGVVTAGVDVARAVFAEANGKVIVVGSATIARFTSNGAPDPTFGTGGIVTNTNGGIEGAAVNGCHIVTVGSQGAAVVVARWRR